MNHYIFISVGPHHSSTNLYDWEHIPAYTVEEAIQKLVGLWTEREIETGDLSTYEDVVHYLDEDIYEIIEVDGEGYGCSNSLFHRRQWLEVNWSEVPLSFQMDLSFLQPLYK